MLSTLIYFTIFAGIDFFLLIAQHQKATHNLNYYLSRIRIEGYLTEDDENKLAKTFSQSGMELDDIQMVPREKGGGGRVLKDINNPENSEITMQLTIKPAVKPFMSGILLKDYEDTGEYKIEVGGSVLSEYVD